MGTTTTTNVSPYLLVFKGLMLIPIHIYMLIALLILFIFLYNLLEMHIIHDIFYGFGDHYVSLTFDSSSELYREVISKCQLLHGRYFSTLWLSGPHLQTMLLNILLKTHDFSYERELFRSSDGGTIALDWLMNFNGFQVNGSNTVAEVVPTVIVIPGLTSDSDSPYIKHTAYKMAKHGWNVVISNHRGLGGVPLTSDCFYTGGSTEDLRQVVNHLHRTQPKAPIFAIGTSIGANILVKYLGEDGLNVPIVGAVSVCNPWDLLMGDRFFARGIMQRFYDKVLSNSLVDIARLHRVVYARIADWEGIEKARSVGDFNKYTARITGNFETVDTLHRWASSVYLVKNVAVPLVCINAIDDPVCTYEAIPWDECRNNKNIVLATTQHGGHLAFFEGMSGKNLWWVRVVEEYFCVLHSSSLMNKKQTRTAALNNPKFFCHKII